MLSFLTVCKCYHFVLSFFLVQDGRYHLCYHLMLSFFVIISPFFFFLKTWHTPNSQLFCYTVYLKKIINRLICTVWNNKMQYIYSINEASRVPWLTSANHWIYEHQSSHARLKYAVYNNMIYLVCAENLKSVTFIYVLGLNYVISMELRKDLRTNKKHNWTIKGSSKIGTLQKIYQSVIQSKIYVNLHFLIFSYSLYAYHWLIN